MKRHTSLVRREITGKNRSLVLENLVYRAITKTNPTPQFTRISQNIKNNMRRMYGRNLSDENIRKVITYMHNHAHGKTPNVWKRLPWNNIIFELVMNYPVFGRYRR